MYACPMHKDVTSDKSGKCGKCGMALREIKDQSPPQRDPAMAGRSKIKDHGEHGDHHAMMEKDFKQRFFVTLPLVLLVIALSPHIQDWLGISFILPLPGQRPFGPAAAHNVILFVLSTIILIYGGLPFYKAAKGEIAARNFGMMTLVSLAITVGYLFSVAATFFFPGESLYWEISTLIAAFLFGHWLEMRAVAGTTGALAELAKLIPTLTHVIRGKQILDIQTDQVKKGEKILVKPGEKMPLDGIVLEGESLVNESMITGESRPVGKKKADMVIGGTINNDGSLTIEVMHVGEETAVAKIMDLIAQAQSTKPTVQKLADKAANALTIVAILVGIGTFLFWMFMSPQGAIFAATLAVAVVVVACPHALGLAIPTVTTITSTLAAKNGILIKDMKGLEVARRVTYVVFDKTGTLTKGEFGVAEIVGDETILERAAAVESHSQHSIAQSIVSEAKKRKIKIAQVTNFISYPGKGASGLVENTQVVVGNEALLEQLGISTQKIHSLKTSQKGTLIYVAVDKVLKGVLVLSDVVRAESKDAILRLKKEGIKTAMLTGDRADVAEDVGKTLGIDTIFAQVLPEDKVAKIKSLQEKGEVVAMVGDGVNDAPSLTQAHVGIAIGAGTDVAVESAEVVLVRNDPRDVVKAISLSKKTNAKMVQNLLWATGYNVLAIPAAAGMFYQSLGILLRPEWAALLMSASSIIVVANALLLRREMV